MSRAELDSLHDDLYILSAALDDVTRDLADADADPDPAEVRRALDWLVESAEPLRDRSIITPGADSDAR